MSALLVGLSLLLSLLPVQANPIASSDPYPGLFCGPIPNGARINPEPVPNAAIDYPLSARISRIEGEVVIGFVIEPDGSTSNVRVLRSTGYAVLNDAVTEAAAHWKFKPILEGAQPIYFHDMRTVSFSLSRDGRGPGATVSPSCAVAAPPPPPPIHVVPGPHPIAAVRAVGVHSGFYPQDALADREEGKVLVSFTIQPDGSTTNPTVETSSGHPLLDQAALDSVLTWRYAPLPAPLKYRAYVMFMVPENGACEPVSIGGILASALSGIPLCKM